MRHGRDPHDDASTRDTPAAMLFEVDEDGGVLIQLTPEELEEERVFEELMERNLPIVCPAPRAYDECDGWDTEQDAARDLWDDECAEHSTGALVDIGAAPPEAAPEPRRSAGPGASSVAHGSVDGASPVPGRAPRGARATRAAANASPVRAEACFTPEARRLGAFVRALGVVPLHLAVRMLEAIDGQPGRMTYTASRQLHAAGVMDHRLAVRDLDVPRVRGLQKVLVAGPRFRDWSGECADRAAARGESQSIAVGPAPLSPTAPDAMLREQLALAYAVLARVIGGWRVVRDDEWLRPAVELAIKRSPVLGYGVALGRARDRGACRLEEGHQVVGLLPPEAVGAGASAPAPAPKAADPRLLPCLIVGGTWMTQPTLARAFPKLRYVHALEVLAARDSVEAVKRLQMDVRRLAKSHQAETRVTTLRTKTVGDWDRIVTEVDDAFGSTARDKLRTRVHTWLAPSVE